VGRRVRRYREQLGLTRERLAELSGASPSAIYRLERGDNVTLDSYLLIIEYLAGRRLPDGLIELIVLLPQDGIDRIFEFARWYAQREEDRRN
jgi:transcriptional regulator with XRE-family HTH domain